MPPGVTLCTVTYGKALGALGAVARITGKVTMDRRIVHAATGWSINPADEDIPNTGEELTFAVPHVDQPGFLDTAGQDTTHWYYTLTGKIIFTGGGKSVSYSKTFQPLVGQTNIDLDLVLDGPVQPGVSAPSAEVLSVAGRTGHVSGSDMVEALEPDLSASYAAQVRPSSLPVDRALARPYDRPRNLYNANPAQLIRTKRKLARIRNGAYFGIPAERLRILWTGDSNTEGANVTKSLASPPAHLADMLRRSGLASAGDGLVFMRSDDRWTRGDWAARGSHLHGFTSTSAGTAKFTSNLNATALDYWYDGRSPAHQISLDGDIDIYAVPTTGNAIEKMTFAGLGNTRHSLKIIPGGAGVTAYGVETYSAMGASVTNAGMSGANSTHWTPGDAAADSPYKLCRAWAPDLVIHVIGTNDFGNSIPVATLLQNMLDYADGWTADTDVVFGVPIPRGGSGDQSLHVAALYTAAEAKGVRLVDLTDRWGSYAQANSLGFYADTLHGNHWSYRDLAEGVRVAADLPTGEVAAAYTGAAVPTEPGALLISDSFNRADSSTLGNTETGAKTWGTFSGVMQIASNQLSFVSSTDPSNRGARAWLDAGVTSYRVSATLIPGGLYGCGLVFRQDRAAYSGWSVEGYTPGTTYKLIKSTSAGNHTVMVDTGVPVAAAGASNRVRVTVNAATDVITVHIDGVQVAQVTDAFNNAATEVGFLSRGGSRRADMFQVRDLT